MAKVAGVFKCQCGKCHVKPKKIRIARICCFVAGLNQKYFKSKQHSPVKANAATHYLKIIRRINQLLVIHY